MSEAVYHALPEKQGLRNSKRRFACLPCTHLHPFHTSPHCSAAPHRHLNTIIYHLNTLSTCIPKSRPNPFSDHSTNLTL
jgi:hypothetical protein